MKPLLKPAGFPFSDRILHKNFILNGEKLKGKLVVVMNPYRHNDFIVRRVIAEENEWV